MIPWARRAAVPALALAVALAVRLAPAGEVFGGDGPRLIGDSDPHYHVLRVERWLRGDPGAPWRDPALDWPAGADVPWPPLFDAIVAGGARAVAGSPVDRGTLLAVAAVIPVLLGLVLVVLVARLGRAALGAGAGWIAAFVVAATSGGADHSRLGRADQHALELVLFVALLLALVSAPRSRRRAALAVGVAVACAFWTWMGSALFLVVLLAIAASLHVLQPSPDDRTEAVVTSLAAGAAAGAVMLVASVLLFAPAGALASAATCGVGGLQVATTAAAALAAALLLLGRRARPAVPRSHRALEALASGAVAAGLLLAVPPLRAGLAGGLVALGAANPWYAVIGEFQPLLGAGDGLVTELVGVTRGYGLVFLAAPFGVLPLVRLWRASPERRPAIAVVAVTLALFVPAVLLRKRFGAYAIVPLAIMTELAVRELARVLAARWPRLASPRAAAGALAVASLAIVAPSLPEHGLADPVLAPEQEDLLRWIGSRPAPPGREGVLAPWSYGHVIQFFAGRPVVASPFGTEGGARALEDSAEFWFAPDGPAAEAVLERRRCGLVLLGLVPPETMTLHGFAPEGTAAPLALVNDLVAGGMLVDLEPFWRLVPIRLYYEDGLAGGPVPAIDGFRLLAETPATSPDQLPLEARWKLYEPVAGARAAVRGAAGVAVRASVSVLTNVERRFEWWIDAEVGADGVADLRLPYASGMNGAVRASAWELSDGARTVRLVVHEDDVVRGVTFDVDLRAGSVARRGRDAVSTRAGR